jgi:hypothetical protein
MVAIAGAYDGGLGAGAFVGIIDQTVLADKEIVARAEIDLRAVPLLGGVVGLRAHGMSPLKAAFQRSYPRN